MLERESAIVLAWSKRAARGFTNRERLADDASLRGARMHAMQSGPEMLLWHRKQTRLGEKTSRIALVVFASSLSVWCLSVKTHSKAEDVLLFSRSKHSETTCEKRDSLTPLVVRDWDEKT